MDAIIVIRNIVVENANSIAGKTRGFPAISNFLGYMYALQRRLPEISKLDMADIRLSGCGVICHKPETQTYQVADHSEQVFSLSHTRLTRPGKFSTFVEDERMNMTVSLVIAVANLPELDYGFEITQLENEIKILAESKRLAGGRVVSISSVSVDKMQARDDKQDTQLKLCLNSLAPGFALVNRSDLLNEPSTILYEFDNSELETVDSQNNGFDKVNSRTYPGWIKPIPVGYKVISPLYPANEVVSLRENETSVCFVETIYSLGEWINPHRIRHFKDLFWSYTTESNDTHFLCRNSYQPESGNEDKVQAVSSPVR